MAAHHVVLAERKLMTYVYAPMLGGSLQSWYQSGFPAFQFHNLPASATVISELCREIHGSSSVLLLLLVTGPLPNEDADLPYRNPEIYSDMYLGRFQDAMLPYIPRDLGDLELQALYLLREGLPSEIRIFVPAPMAGMTVEHMINDIMEAEIIAHMLQVDALVDDIIQVPVDDAGIPEPLFEGGPLMLKDPIPAVPLQEISP
ncbi:hypothetical protein TIFTF001_031508 [Ficus carica]|uniref:Uncharacterized protein n=1 Tax=Ficus carica TaxID=3494 RepID=A0AA88DV51_FICCA|nr:hypothetical protein TIFTF001_031508 [Ficus carica]